MSFKRALLVIGLLTLQAALSGGFYIPGVAPTEYDEGEQLIVKVGRVILVMKRYQLNVYISM